MLSLAFRKIQNIPVVFNFIFFKQVGWAWFGCWVYMGLWCLVLYYYGNSEAYSRIEEQKKVPYKRTKFIE